MHFGLYLVRAGAISADEFVTLLERQLRDRAALGELAIELRKLSMRQVFAVLSAQASSEKPFGEIAVDLGYLSRPDLWELLAVQNERGRPLKEIAIETGLIDEATAARHLQAYRSKKLQNSAAATHAARTNQSAMADATN